MTNTPPTINNINSCFVSTAIVPIAPPIARLPTSPMNTWAGGALNHRNPRLAPTMAPQNTVSSAASGRCVRSRYLVQRDQQQVKPWADVTDTIGNGSRLDKRNADIPGILGGKVFRGNEKRRPYANRNRELSCQLLLTGQTQAALPGH